MCVISIALVVSLSIGLFSASLTLALFPFRLLSKRAISSAKHVFLSFTAFFFLEEGDSFPP